MRFRDIIAALADDTKLPILPKRLAQVIMSDGNVERIVFVGVDLDTKILRGKFVRVTFEEGKLGPIPPPYAIPNNGLVIKVYYARNQPDDFIRLVINKELLHVVDPDRVRTATKDQVAALVNKLRLPLELWHAPGEDFSIETFVDSFSDLRAVAAMVPERLRILARQKHAENKIDEDELAGLLGIPRRYVASILSDRWENLRSFWLRI